MAISIKHDLHFETIIDENNETAKKLLKLPPENQRMMLEAMLEDLVAPELASILNKLNERNTWAELKIVGGGYV